MPTGWRPDDVTLTNPIEIIEDPYNYEKYDSNTNPMLLFWSSFQLMVHLAMQFHLIYF